MLVQSRASSFSRTCAVVIKDRSQPVFVTGSFCRDGQGRGMGLDPCCWPSDMRVTRALRCLAPNPDQPLR